MLFDSLNHLPSFNQPIALTVGNFDGVHLGHQRVLERVKQSAQEQKGLSAVFTFSNHPSTVLRPDHPTPLINSPAHKVKLLEEAGIDLIFLLPFTPEFSQLSAEEFVHLLKNNLSFASLILGYDGRIGKNRSGDRQTLEKLASAYHFILEYVDPLFYQGHPISSSRIRSCIAEGQLEETSTLLGRPYSIYERIDEGMGVGQHLGFPTANLTVDPLCTPPLGVWVVECHTPHQSYLGIANLGKAPTLRDDQRILLEVHLFDTQEDLLSSFLDVQFLHYLRPEQRFASIPHLQAQIQQDISQARQFLETYPSRQNP